MTFDFAPHNNSNEPIAIIGIGCRFPGGVRDPESFWELLRDGVDAIKEIPVDRLGGQAGFGSQRGGFLENIAEFDANFFGISPKEAERLDPQQRLLLEVSWEAIEDAGMNPDRLSGSLTGVFIGLWLNDYEEHLFADLDSLDLHSTTGTGRYTASGRLSYFFGFRGPSLTVDTHCSSSLVAVHLACQSLWSGESSLALAGGSNLILRPHITLAYSRSNMMALDGHCKFGSANADGYVRSEGVGVVVLKPLTLALADGDPIYAQILSTAVSSQGSSGGALASPARQGQEYLLRMAYTRAGISPKDVSYVEAHGTGTSAGDPVEIETLGRVFGENRSPEKLCALGSVKTNFGHTEGAAGIAGLIKAALSIKHLAIPPSLHLGELNPHIPWDELPIYIPTRLSSWPQNGNPVYAGVSSFGIAGTNAHAVIAEAPQSLTSVSSSAESTRWDLLTLSARTPAALRDMVERYIEFLTESSRLALRDLCYTAGVRRTHHKHRLAVVADTTQTAAALLRNFSRGEEQPGVVTGFVGDSGSGLPHPKLVFVFPGMGSQWQGMGRELLKREPVFSEAISRFDRAVQSFAGWSILEQMQLEPGDPGFRMDQMDIIQPVLLAFEIGLAELLNSQGVIPDAVVGHSMGEIGAAYFAGSLTVEDAARIICLRSQLLKQISGKGGMAVVGLGFEKAQEIIQDHEQSLAVAVSSSYRSSVLSGDLNSLQAVLADLTRRDIFSRMVNVDGASHAPLVEPLRAELVHQLQGLQPCLEHIPVYSTVTASKIDGLSLDEHYWGMNLRQPVLLAGVTEQLLKDGYTIFLELSPHPILISAIQDTIHLLGKDAHAVPTLKREEMEFPALLTALGQLHTVGYPLNFEKIFPEKGQVVRLPTYPWQRKRYWFEPTGDGKDWQSNQIPADPLLGSLIPDLAALPGLHVWNNRLNIPSLNHIRALLAEQIPLAPERIFSEMALSAAKSVFGPRNHRLGKLEVSENLSFDEGVERTLQFVLDANPQPETPADERAAFTVYSREKDESPWLMHASGEIEVGQVDLGWMYSLEWIPKALERHLEEQPELEEGHWLIFTDQTGVGQALARLLEARSQTCTLLHRAGDNIPLENGAIQVSTGSPAGFRDALDRVDPHKKKRCRGIIYLWNLDISNLNAGDGLDSFKEAQRLACTYIVLLVKSLLSTGWPESSRLWLASVNSEAVDSSKAETHASGSNNLPLELSQALTWGLSRTIVLEHPELWGGIIDLASETPDLSANAILAELYASDKDDQVVYRDGQRYVPRLVPDSTLQNESTPLVVQSHAAYLITGGLGYIGLSLAGWLVEQGAKNLVLVSRTGLPDRNQWDGVSPQSLSGQRITAIKALEEVGAVIKVARADVSNPAEMSALFDQLQETSLPLRGIFHAAGVFSHQSILDLDIQDLEQILLPKVSGTWVLHSLAQSYPLDFFILFSSITAILGSQNLSAYGAANHFLDRVAHYRNASGVPALSVNWGWWEGERSDPTEKNISQIALNSGSRPMKAGLAIQALEYLMRNGAVHKFVADIDWSILKPLLETRRLHPLLSSIRVVESQKPSVVSETGQVEFVQKLNKASKNKRRELLISLVTDQVRAILGLQAADPVDIHQGFFKLGLDSLMSLQLHKRLETSLNISWPPTVALEYPSIASLVDYFLSDILPVLAEELSGSPDAPLSEARPEGADPLEINLDEISDQDLLSLLDGELSKINNLLEGE